MKVVASPTTIDMDQAAEILFRRCLPHLDDAGAIGLKKGIKQWLDGEFPTIRSRKRVKNELA